MNFPCSYNDLEVRINVNQIEIFLNNLSLFNFNEAQLFHGNIGFFVQNLNEV